MLVILWFKMILGVAYSNTTCSFIRNAYSIRDIHFNINIVSYMGSGAASDDVTKTGICSTLVHTHTPTIRHRCSC